MACRADDGFHDLLGRGFGMHMRVGDEQRPVFQDHQAQRPHRVQPVARQDLADIVQMPQILTEGAADHAVGLAPVDHDRGDGGGIGAHHGTGDVGGHAARAINS
jgi:hypothetical protein